MKNLISALQTGSGSFSLTSALAGFVLIGAAIWVAFSLPKSPDLWRRVPRERYIGSIMGWICLLWSATLVYPILEGKLVAIRNALPYIVVFVAAASFFCLDYLFTRALGGLILLIVNYLLHLALISHLPARPLFAVFCYLFGIAGLFMIGTPYRFRDLLDKATHERQWRRRVSGVLMTAGVLSLTMAAIQHFR